MKFDFVIGNPPYQEEVQNKGDRPNPVYDKFMDASYEIADVVELIHPGRFLFNAGQTSKSWNRKMLNDEHFSVLFYESNSSKVFSGAEIKGGVAITIHNRNRLYGAIGTFTAYDELNSIVKKIAVVVGASPKLDSIIASQGLYRFSKSFFKDYPSAQLSMGTGTGNKIVSNIMIKLPDVFQEVPDKSMNYVRFLGRLGNKRVYRYIRREYLEQNDYIDTYNLFIPEANNSGKYGETLSEPTIGLPGDGAADTFLSAGKFGMKAESEALAKYMKSKLFRALLGIRKVTQHCPPTVWRMIPLQDFTSNSDIDWSQSIANIDKQLYKKYGLDENEINFIETHVKEMA